MSELTFLLDALEPEVTEDGHILLKKLRDELSIEFWPEDTFEAARACFGEAVFNRLGRTYKALDRRIRHALRVWDDKYGPLNPEQLAYADAVLASAIRAGEREAGRDRAKRYAYVQSKIGRAVNHETVDGGFKKRASAEGMIDFSEELSRMVAA